MTKRLEQILPRPTLIFTENDGISVAKPTMRSRAQLRKSLGRHGFWLYDGNQGRKPLLIHVTNRTDQAVGMMLINVGLNLCGMSKRSK